MLNKKELLDGFRQTSVKSGETIIVHTSYKSLGGVEGGAETVIDAMRELVGPQGTVTVSYTHLRAHETVLDLVCRLLLEKKKANQINHDAHINIMGTLTLVM